MLKSRSLLLTALLATGMLQAQTPAPPAQAPDATQTPAKTPTLLPVPGGGLTMGPNGLGQPNDRPAPTKEEALKKAKEEAYQIADLQARRISQQLTLTSQQFNAVRALLIGREEELHKALGPDAPGSKDHPFTPQERQARFQQVQQDTMTKIAALLTPQQKEKFDGLVARSRAERSRRAAIATSHRAVQPTNPAAPGSAPNPSTPATPTQAPPATPAAPQPN